MPTVVSNAPIISQKSVVRHDPRDAEIAELKAKLDAATRLAPSNFQSNAGLATYPHSQSNFGHFNMQSNAVNNPYQVMRHPINHSSQGNQNQIQPMIHYPGFSATSDSDAVLNYVFRQQQHSIDRLEFENFMRERQQSRMQQQPPFGYYH